MNPAGHGLSCIKLPGSCHELVRNIFQAIAVFVTDQRAAFLIPVTQHHTPRLVAVNYQLVNGRAMRMPMDKQIDTVPAHYLFNLLLVDIHDIQRFPLRLCFTFRAIFMRELQTLRYRF